ncbi:MAG: hypothetical protein KC466_13390, partial [Myxococcales bacterium]|nr:hypothetical protein [Myxococcales bacterium]
MTRALSVFTKRSFVVENRGRSKALAAGIVLALAFWSTAAWAGAAPTTASPAALPSVERYQAAKAKAWAWLAALKIDAADLTLHRVKGKKKVGEMLAALLLYHRHAKTDAERAVVLQKVAEVEKQTRTPAYHDLADASDRVFTENSMSYFRVLWLLQAFGRDTKDYRARLDQVKPRMDAHLVRRGPWQREMFAEYYDRFGLAKPPILTREAKKLPGVIDRRLPADRYDRNDTYNLTHEVFVAFDYGLQHEQTRLTIWDLDYCRKTLAALARRFMAARDTDLVGELASSMVYLGYGDDPDCVEAIRYLIDAQNANGSWG